MKKTHGLSLIELLVLLTALGIIVYFAYPFIRDYSRRIYYDDILTVTKKYQDAVSKCVQRLGTRIGCNDDTNGIPPGINTPQGPIQNLDVINGIITVRPVPSRGILATDTYILAPRLSRSGLVTWTTSGDAFTKGYAREAE